MWAQLVWPAQWELSGIFVELETRKYELPDKGHNSWRHRQFFVYNVHDGLIIHMENYLFVSIHGKHIKQQ
jgi:hypothetical protein